MTISLSSLQISPLGNLFPPPSQKAGDRPISFFLVDNTQSGASPSASPFSLSGLASLVAGGAGQAIPSASNTQSITLNIRPEELTRTEPSRAVVQQTLGGAWLDDWDEGISQINISGHTGWRGTATTDGLTLFANLRQMVFKDFHAKRRTALASGKDPNGVVLTFADSLNNIVENVYTMQFTLRRSRSRPLLAQYQISMLSLGAGTKPKTTSLLSGILSAAGLTSLANAVDTITSAISTVQDFVQNDIIGPVKAFMGVAAAVFNSVVGMVNSVTGIVTSVMDTATGIARAGAQMFQTLASIGTLPATIMAQAVGVASAFTNVFCLLSNTPTAGSVYPNYTALLGASNCSSTAGGAPSSTYVLTGKNPFDDVIGSPTTPPVQISSQASIAVQSIALTDPVLSPMTPAQIKANLNIINSGIKVNS